MARIRSIHPGIWTDEQFAALPMGSRVLLFGIWTEADDHGVFEWNPLKLKMRIFPADKVDIEPMLTDLSLFGIVKEFSHDNRKYGVVRNFCKYQKPKKPTYRFVLPDELRTYAGIKAEGTEPVPNQLPTGGENGSLMEKEDGEGEGIGEEEKKDHPKNPKKPYAFTAGVIRLTQDGFEKWEKAFPHLSLASELTGLADWAGQQPKWFPAVSGALAKREREVCLRLEQFKIEAAASRGTGPPRVDPRL